MPKIKTHSGAKKRFKKTATGRIKVKASGTRHILAKKGESRMRKLHQAHYIDPSMERRVGRLLPNG